MSQAVPFERHTVLLLLCFARPWFSLRRSVMRGGCIGLLAIPAVLSRDVKQLKTSQQKGYSNWSRASFHSELRSLWIDVSSFCSYIALTYSFANIQEKINNLKSSLDTAIDIHVCSLPALCPYQNSCLFPMLRAIDQRSQINSVQCWDSQTRKKLSRDLWDLLKIQGNFKQATFIEVEIEKVLSMIENGLEDIAVRYRNICF